MIAKHPVEVTKLPSDSFKASKGYVLQSTSLTVPIQTVATALNQETPGRSPRQPAKVKLGRSRGMFVDAQLAIAAILQQFDTGEGRTQLHLELTPATGLIQRLAHAPD